jgi:phosphopantothenoylcysteine decarboxylase/phosphopantothenate--cysteine ligase
MNQAMWANHRTQRVVALLQADPQIDLWGPAEGQQACGDNGPGRMLEPEQIMQALAQAQMHAHASHNGGGVLAGKRLVITAGPTREPIDPVRYISNHSSGKMGYALAIAAQAAGAEVVLVSGPVNLPPPAGINLRSVITAEQMLETTMAAVDEGCDLFIATAAVADYRPQDYAGNKLKKSAAEMTLELVRTPDTLATVAARADAPFTVGFAAETNDVARYAVSKMRKKGLDMIVANDVSVPGLGFNSDNNAVSVFTAAGQVDLGPCSKQQIAHELVALIAPSLNASQNNSDRKPS